MSNKGKDAHSKETVSWSNVDDVSSHVYSVHDADFAEEFDVEPKKKNKMTSWIGKLSSYFKWRGLEDDAWDVHTLATAPSVVDGGDPEIRRAASIVSDGGYVVTNRSVCSCLNGKCGGFFDTFNAPVFLTSTAFTVGFIILFASAPDLAGRLFPPVKDWISIYFGWFYVVSIDIMLAILIYICLARYGDVRLGSDDSRPEFSFVSWVTMLFSAGMGIGLVFYGVAEPLLNYTSPPHRIYGDSDELAFERAIPLTIFNWGIHAWAVYSALGLAICYFSARLKLPLSIRSALYPLLGSWTLRWPGHIVDIIAVIGTICGLATSLGLGTIQLNAGLNFLNEDIPVSFATQSIIVISVTIVAMASVLSGTSKGMKWLSNINSGLAFILFLSIWFINRPGECPETLPEGEFCEPVLPYGSFLQALEGTVQNFGNYFPMLLERSFRTGAYLESEKDWMCGWTIYYMGWFLSWCPFVSAFLAEISRGRTIRQYIACTIGLPLIVTVFWFSILGLFGMNAVGQWTNPIDFSEAPPGTLETDWNNLAAQPVEEMLFILYQWNRDLGYINNSTMGFLSVITLIVLVIFFVSSSDSGCLVITMIASGGNRNPPKWQKIFWVWICALIALVLLISGGDVALNSLQAMVIVLGLPLCIILLLIMAGLMKTLAHDPYIVHCPKPDYGDQSDLVRMFRDDLVNAKQTQQEKRKNRNSMFYKAEKNAVQEQPPIINTFDIEAPRDVDDTSESSH